MDGERAFTKREESSAAQIEEGFKQCRVPLHLQSGLKRFVVHRIKPGHFLMSILENDLFNAINLASGDITIGDIRSIVQCMYNFAEPSTCFGTKEKVQQWLTENGEVLT